MDTDTWITGLLLVSAAIHLPPVLGVLGTTGMERAYGTTIAGPDLAILMRHRAVLFGLLGALLATGAFVEDLRWPAIVGGLVSDVAFAVLCGLHRDHGPKLGTVLKPDLLSIVLLASAALLAVA